MLAAPARIPLASPEALIVATEVLELDHAAVVVRIAVLPSLKVPVAVNCCVWPSSMEALRGATEMKVKVGGGGGAGVVTVNAPVLLVIPS